MDEHAVLDACQRFRWERNLRRARGTLGAHTGDGVGASVEFHDFRRYLPGDDPRHVDWAVYGRTGDLFVRLYREEITPGVDILLDGSRSMAIDDGRKADLARELCAFALESTRLEGGRAALHVLGDQRQRLDDPKSVRFDAAGTPLFEQPTSATGGLRSGTMRIVLSDFLTPVSPAAAIREFSAGAAQLIVIMILGPWEASPDEGGHFTLTDIETREALPAGVVDDARRRYLRRLEALRSDLVGSCRTFGATFVEVVADTALGGALERDFLPLGVVRPV